MALSDIVQVNITTANPGVTQAGFGVPLLVTSTATWTERTRVYKNLAAVASDFATTTPEYLAAEGMFAQNPAPPQIMIGRAALKPTQVHVVTIDTVITTAGTKYQVNAFFNGALQTATFTTVGSDTNDSIVTGLVSALNALTSPNFTAAATGSIGSHVVTCTANAAGNWFAIEPLASNLGGVSNLMEVAETEVDPGIATDLTAIALESSAWYGLVLLFKSSAIVLAAAGWVESNTKLFLVSTADTQCATIADGSASDVGHGLKAAARARTAADYHPRNYEFLDACTIAKFFPISPGGDNWRLKTLSGPTPVNYTGTQTTNLQAKRMGYYYILGGVNVIGGNATVSDNEYIDVIRFRDWWVARMGERLANLLIQSNKVPYTDAGIALIEAEVRAQNAEGIAAGGINPGSPPGIPAPSVTVPKSGDVSSADRAARQLNNVNTSWTLAGAINFLTVNAAITS